MKEKKIISCHLIFMHLWKFHPSHSHLLIYSSLSVYWKLIFYLTTNFQLIIWFKKLDRKLRFMFLEILLEIWLSMDFPLLLVKLSIHLWLSWRLKTILELHLWPAWLQKNPDSLPVQVDNFQKVPFVYNFMKQFQQKFCIWVKFRYSEKATK